MNKKGYFFLNLLLAFSIIGFIFIFIVSIFTSDKQHAAVLDILPIFLMIAGLAVTFLTKATKSAYQLFIGFFFTFIGLFLYWVMIPSLELKMIRLWPITGLICGLSLFIAGIYKYRRIASGFVVPSVILFLFSLLFLMFSLKVFTVPFRQLMVICAPVLFIVAAFSLFGIYYFQQRKKGFVDGNDSMNQFEDDELIPEES
ncbi:MAG: hypothetical protein MJ160_03155 [Treponema sp.]|nr:hypothetical protein [Treponema sp.]